MEGGNWTDRSTTVTGDETTDIKSAAAAAAADATDADATNIYLFTHF